MDGVDHYFICSETLLYGKYFKRELKKPIDRNNKFLNKQFKLLNKISFSIPKSKIISYKPKKVKLFTKHVQCEVAYEIKEVKENSERKYSFFNEKEYYNDIAESYYGITMKKAGWDCMRHYEIAANMSIPFFYKQSEKPKECAPYGLIDLNNVISFDDSNQLLEKINYIKKITFMKKSKKTILNG